MVVAVVVLVVVQVYVHVQVKVQVPGVQVALRPGCRWSSGQ